MAEWPGHGQMRWYTEALDADDVSFSWRQMPPDTGGRGSYGHHHEGLEEIYFVISGTLTFKVGDDVFEAPPQTAVRMHGDAHYSVHNDGDAEAEVLIFNRKVEDLKTNRQDGFWLE